MKYLRYIWAWLFWNHGKFMFSNISFKKRDYLDGVESDCKVIIREKVSDNENVALYNVFFKLK